MAFIVYKFEVSEVMEDLEGHVCYDFKTDIRIDLQV